MVNPIVTAISVGCKIQKRLYDNTVPSLFGNEQEGVTISGNALSVNHMRKPRTYNVKFIVWKCQPDSVTESKEMIYSHSKYRETGGIKV